MAHLASRSYALLSLLVALAGGAPAVAAPGRGPDPRAATSVVAAVPGQVPQSATSRRWRAFTALDPPTALRRASSVSGTAVLVIEVIGAAALILAIRARERSLARHYRLTDSVLRGMKDGVLVGDAAGRVRLANESARRLLGLEPRGAPSADLLAARRFCRADGSTPYLPDDLPIARALRGETVPDTEVFLRGGGAAGPAWLTVSGTPLRDGDGGVSGGVAILRDITERRRSEAVVSLLYEAVERTSDTVFITDRDGRIEFVNAAFEATTGYGREEAIGRTPRLLRSDQQPDAFYKRLWTTILAGEVFRDVVVNRTKSGALWYADQTITPRRDSAGNVTHFVSVLRDMTEQRRRQEAEIEMQFAARIQRRLYPEDPPRFPGCDCHGAVFPAVATCGDYFDFIPMDGARFGVAIGDVSGHGFGPALVMAETRALLRAYSRARADLGDILTEVNVNLASDLEPQHFVTLLMAAIDLDRRSLVYVNAGHPSGWVLDAGGAVKACLRSRGLPLGVVRDFSYAASEAIDLADGDVVVLLTDGVIEFGSSEAAHFDDQRVLDVVRGCREEPARRIVTGIYEAVRAFASGLPQEDDIAIVVCKIGAEPPA